MDRLTFSVERFRLESVLGEGGMATVFAAHDLNLDRPVAIKRLHSHLADDPAAVARFLREASVMARLSSENTVRVYELGQHADGKPYLVMERVWGSPLHDLVEERGVLPVEEAIEYIRQACIALAEAHDCGIVHRDVKPSNILVEGSGGRAPRVKLLDFGVAKARPHSEDHSGLTSLSEILGTPEYMAPEQLYSSRLVDSRVDIWGLGATLYFMLVGEAPFTAPDFMQLMDRIQHGPAPSLRPRRPDVPAHVEEVILRCLHRDPIGRYSSVGDVARALSKTEEDGDESLTDDTCADRYEPTIITEGARHSEPELETTKILPFALSVRSSPASPPPADPLRAGAPPGVDADPPSGPPSAHPPSARPPSASSPSTRPPAASPTAAAARGRWLLPAALSVGVILGALVMQLLARL